MSETFALKLQDFEGPLDLLLQLIEKRKLHICQVNIATITDDYVAYLSQFEYLPKHETADFLVVASTLMLIKSASLLPGLSLTAEEETDAEELERRLKLYQYIQCVGINIKKIYGENPLFFREPNKNITPVFTPTAEITKDGLLTAIHKILSSLPKMELIHQVIIKKVRSLQETIEDLAARIQSAISLKFSEFAPRDRAEKISVIVSFLGMLELVKQGMIEVEQHAHYADIDMQSTKPGIPRY